MPIHGVDHRLRLMFQHPPPLSPPRQSMTGGTILPIICTGQRLEGLCLVSGVPCHLFLDAITANDSKKMSCMYCTYLYNTPARKHIKSTHIK